MKVVLRDPRCVVCFAHFPSQILGDYVFFRPDQVCQARVHKLPPWTIFIVKTQFAMFEDDAFPAENDSVCAAERAKKSRSRQRHGVAPRVGAQSASG